MDTIRSFLARAVRLEAEAAGRFDELAEHMATLGNPEVAQVFRQLADFSRLHLQDAMARAGFRHIGELPPDQYGWADGDAPESAPWWGVDGLMDVPTALRLALESERSGLAFYRDVAARTPDPRVRMMAQAFAEEEAGHVELLVAWLSRVAG